VTSIGEAGSGAVALPVCADGDNDDCEESDGESIAPVDHCHRLLALLFIVSPS
jgi:hypothetical protein